MKNWLAVATCKNNHFFDQLKIFKTQIHIILKHKFLQLIEAQYQRGNFHDGLQNLWQKIDDLGE